MNKLEDSKGRKRILERLFKGRTPENRYHKPTPKKVLASIIAMFMWLASPIQAQNVNEGITLACKEREVIESVGRVLVDRGMAAFREAAQPYLETGECSLITKYYVLYIGDEYYSVNYGRYVVNARIVEHRGYVVGEDVKITGWSVQVQILATGG
jgi:hypothetical protein